MGIIFFIIGLIVGSFLNVVIVRLRSAESLVFGRSKCPKCQSLIHWYDNLPLISFLILRFRCRSCQEKISWQYPLVELTTALIFAFLGGHFFVLENVDSWIWTLYFWLIAGLFIVIFTYDILYLEIPLVLVWFGTALALAFKLYLDFGHGFSNWNLWESHLTSALLASSLAFLFFFSLAYGSKEKWMGMGDAYLGMFLGMVLGGLAVVYAFSLGFFLGAVLGIILIILKKKKLGSHLPLAPFLIVGSAVMLIWGDEFSLWYMNLFS